MTTLIDVRCVRCGLTELRLDENGWCEQCWLALSSSYQLFQDLEEVVKQALDAGVLTPAQLQEAFRMSLADTEGSLLGTDFRREAVETLERGVWYAPPSAFDDDKAHGRNRIAFFRHMSGLSLEAVAVRIDVPVSTLALWEQDVLPADEDAPAAVRLCRLFEVSPEFLLGLHAPAEEA